MGAVVLAIAIGAPIGIWQSGVVGGGGQVTAHVFVASAVNGGTTNCVRNLSLVSMSAAVAANNVCTTFSKAYQIANQGDTVYSDCETFGAQVFSTRTVMGWTQPILFKPTTDFCAKIYPGSGDGPTLNIGSADWIEFSGFNLEGPCGDTPTTCTATHAAVVTDLSGISDLATNITFTNNAINVGVDAIGGPQFNLHAPQNWTITNNTFGPACCGEVLTNSPETIRIGKPAAGTNDCAHEACNIVIDNNLFQYSNLRRTSDWPAGSPWAMPAGMATCSNANCHLDAIHVFGCITCDVSYNRFYGVTCTSVFWEGGGGQGNDNRDVTMIGNAFTALNDHCNGAISIKGAATTIGGTWNIGFNSANDLIHLGVIGSEAGTVINLYGNYAYYENDNTNNNNAGCAAQGGETLNYQYNVWLNQFGNGGNTQGPCGVTDGAVATGYSPAWAAPNAAPTYPLDMHLSNTGTATGFVPCSSLSVGPGCPVGSDLFGTTWPTVTANAGADQS